MAGPRPTLPAPSPTLQGDVAKVGQAGGLRGEMVTTGLMENKG